MTMHTYPMTQPQLGIYLAEQNATKDVNYNIDLFYRLGYDIDPKRLEQALKAVVDNHPTIKSRIVTTDEGELLFESHEEDAAVIMHLNSEAELIAEMKRKFDLQNERLYRLALCESEEGWILGVSFHHIAFDGMSFTIFNKELNQAYDGVELVPETKDSCTIALEDVAQRESSLLDEQREWYKDTFAAVAECPSGLNGDMSCNEEYKAAWLVMPVIKTTDVMSFCEKHGVKPSTLFTSAFGYVLAKYQGAQRSAFCTVHHGRLDKSTRSAWTMMVKTLPVLVDLEQKQTVAEVLTATGQQMEGTRQKTVFSFGEFCEEMGVNPEILFVYQGALSLDITLSGKTYESNDLRTPEPGFEISLEVFEDFTSDGYKCLINYNGGKYSEAFLTDLTKVLANVMHGMMAEETLSNVQLLDAEQQQEVLKLGEGEELDYDRSETVVSLFRKQATATPDALCVVFDDPSTGERRSYTYHEVDELTDRMARYLTTLGVGPEQPVGVMIDRNEKIVLFPLSIMKAGGAYMPLDSHFPEDRLSFMCEDAGVKVILTEGNLLKEAMPSFAGKVLTYEDIIVGADAELTAPEPENMHVILYTSGSTGKPKGVVLEQHNMANFCHWFTKYFDVTAQDRVAAFANFGFDVHQADLWPILSVGGSIYVIPQDMRLNLIGLEEYINKNQLTLANITTQIGSMFAASVQKCSLRHLIVAGEKLGPTAKPDYGFNNAYGPTECTIYATNYAIEQDYDSSLIGRALTNYSVAVVDSQLNLLPVGVPGELIIIGEGVGRCYLNRPDVTAEKFITYNEQKAYRTGDQVRMMPDGQIDYMGRMDGQVKLRGLRIELGEVEAAIMRHPAVKAVAAAVKDIAGTQHLCAYYVLKEGENASADDVKEFMSKSVTDFMVPDFMTLLDELPYNANGKIDRKQLPMPEVTAQEEEEEQETTHELNALEQRLLDIIATALGTNKIGVSTPLRRYGLTSLASMKLAVQLFKTFGIEIKGKDLSDGSILSVENAILAKWMSPEVVRLSGSEVLRSEEPQTPTTSKPQNLTPAPLTYPQMGVYMDCMKNPGTTLYNVPSKVVFSDAVNSDELQSAVVATIENHQSFRFTFGNVNGEPSQLLNVDMPVEVPVKEMTAEEAKAFEQDFMRPFNLEKGPLFRFEIVKTPDKTILYLDIHHLITDGGSVDLIIREIAARLNNEETEKEEYPYLQFAFDQKVADGGEEYNAAKEFFRSRLSTCEGASEITADMPKNDDAVHTLGTKICPVDLAPVEAMAKRLGVTPMSVFLAAAYYTVCRFVNNKQVYLGTISNGRSNLRTYNTTGMFVNTLALSSEIKEQTVTDYIKETAENFTETIKHEQYPFAQIAADYGFKPEIIFEYQVDVMAGYDVRGVKVLPEVLTLDLAKFKIKIAVYDAADGGHEIQIGYDEAIYSPALAQTLAASLGAVVEHFVSQPDALVKTISIMSKEQEQQVESLRSVATAPVESKLFYEPIEKFALSQPDKVALIAADRTLTYSEFNAEANRVAHALMARGVQKGDRVVVLLPRTSAVMLTIFGVSKAGAAYIPCDPEYPADRINLITEDSEARFVITTKEKMENYPGKAIDIEEIISYEGENCFDNPNVDVTTDDLVYLIYTSGSTGRPKGVMLRHEGICNYLQCHPGNRHIYAMATEGSCYLSVTTLSFDMSLKEYGVALFNGLTLVLTDETQSNNPIELARLFNETNADIFNATPSRLLNYMELPEFCDALRQCKCVLSGGEAYSDKLLARLHELGPKHIFNTYGPTEITVSSNCAELTNTDHITIGQPLLNYIEFVVDVDGNELPVGVVGELYIGGVGVAKGYNNLEKQTKERFVEYKGVRCYRSGDYARWTPDGRIVTLGRMDNQIKLRGLRIELGEVESAICKVEGVKQTVVMVKKIDNVEHLTAYFTADHPIDIEDMKAQIGTTLTHYMVPTAYLQMEKFPLTPNGKTDVKHLPEPQLAKVGGDYVAPKNKVEEDFCHIFESILTLDKVSAADSFFELGGTSLTATRVMIEAKNLGYDVAYSEVFSNPTAQALAKVVNNDNDNDNDDPEVTDYDYTMINELLQGNNLDSFRKGERLPLGDVLLTGANGYLGIHILHNLLENHLKENPQYKVYCLVRHGRNGVTSEDRLKNLLFYYFEQDYKEMLGTQLIVVDGDVTNPQAFDEVAKIAGIAAPVSASDNPLTVINCAAIVKHFSEGTEIEDINIGGLQNCVDFCLKTGTRLIQTSTNSTGGESVNGYPDPQTNYGEQVHYFGQYLRSKYTHSKFLAERIVLESIIEKGLVAKVVRLGNLAPRAVDGEFQINFRSNSAMGRLHIFQMLGACSYNTAVSKMEFSPIDEVADAILRLSTTPKECCIFHPFNDHMVKLGDVVQEMTRTLNVDIAEVEEEEFQSRLNEAAQDPEKAQILQSMLAYKANSKEQVSYFAKYNPFTIQVLARLGFHWNVTSWDYVSRFISAIAALDFFEDER